MTNIRLLLLLAAVCVNPGSATVKGHCRFSHQGKAAVGQKVTLDCLFPKLNLKEKIIECIKRGLRDAAHVYVHVYRHSGDYADQQAEQFEKRTALNHDDLITGSVRLNFSVQLGDIGEYMCKVINESEPNWTKLEVADVQQTTVDYNYTTMTPEVENTPVADVQQTTVDYNYTTTTPGVENKSGGQSKLPLVPVPVLILFVSVCLVLL